MKHEKFSYKEKYYTWSCEQDSEHPDFVLICDEGEIWVQVEINSKTRKHNELWHNGKVKYPIPLSTVERLISSIVIEGHIDKYLPSDYGLTLRENGKLVKT